MGNPEAQGRFYGKPEEPLQQALFRGKSDYTKFLLKEICMSR